MFHIHPPRHAAAWELEEQEVKAYSEVLVWEKVVQFLEVQVLCVNSTKDDLALSLLE